MTRKTVSMRGEDIDFDLLDIKAKMQKLDKPLDVKTREDFVHMKRRRRGSLNMEELVKNKKTTELQSAEYKQQLKPATPETEDATVEMVETVETASTPKRKIVKKD